MASKSIAHEAAIDSEPIWAQGIIVKWAYKTNNEKIQPFSIPKCYCCYLQSVHTVNYSLKLKKALLSI